MADAAIKELESVLNNRRINLPEEHAIRFARTSSSTSETKKGQGSPPRSDAEEPRAGVAPWGGSRNVPRPENLRSALVNPEARSLMPPSNLRIDSVANDAPRAPTGGSNTLGRRSRTRTRRRHACHRACAAVCWQVVRRDSPHHRRTTTTRPRLRRMHRPRLPREHPPRTGGRWRWSPRRSDLAWCRSTSGRCRGRPLVRKRVRA